jgi:hypothetical protein
MLAPLDRERLQGRSRSRLAPFAFVFTIPSALASAASGQQTTSFDCRSFPGYGVPLRTIVADVDADGDLDLVEGGNYYLTVRWNLGNGGWSQPSLIPTASLRDFAVVDRDGDTDLDLVVGTSSTVRIHTFDGTGFGAPLTVFTSGAYLPALATGDLDLDGRLDLVVAQNGPAMVLVLLGTPSGGFLAPVAYPVASAVSHLSVADLDLDGTLDIASSGFGTALSVLLNQGNGTYSAAVPYGIGSSSYDLAAADLDGDGDLDLASAGGAGVQVRSNFGGTFGPATTLPLASFPSPSAIGAVDFDLDLDLDLVAAHSDGVIGLYENKGGIFVLSGRSSLMWGALDIEVGDMDGDGRSDLIVGFGSSDGGVAILDGRGDGTFGGPETTNVGLPRRILAGDFTGDGVLDLVSHGVSVFLLAGDGSGGLLPPSALPVTDGVGAAGDVDGDGDLDLVATGLVPYAVFLNDGSGGFTPGASATSPNRYEWVAMGDLDGDQDLDLALANRLGSRVELRWNDGTGAFGAPVEILVPGGPRRLMLRDLDGDQDLDIALSCSSGSGVRLLMNGGTGGFTSTLGPTAHRTEDVAALDLDLDGDLDLAQVGDGQVTLLTGSGTGTFSLLSTFQEGWASRIAGGDVDGDGDDDLVTSGGFDFAKVSYWASDGAGALAPPEHLPLSYLPWDLGLVDVDGDLDLDVVAAVNPLAGGHELLAIHRNTRIEAPRAYCRALTTSNGCVPGLASSGIPSASSSAPFLVTATGLRNRKLGMLVYGFGAQARPFQGGSLCIAPPFRRTAPRDSGGSPAHVDDCTGTFALDFNPRIQSGLDPRLVPGAEVDAQHWSRDPGASLGSGLTDALHFRIRP